MHPSTPPQKTSGRYVVFGMFLMATIFGCGLWAYLELTASRFQPLLVALKQQFPDAQMRAEGGRYKSHIPGENRLRIIFRAQIEPQNDQTVLNLTNQIGEVAAQQGFDQEFPQLEIYFYPLEASPQKNYRTLRTRFADLPLITFPNPEGNPGSKSPEAQ